ncbi:MAG: helix-turn-helix transcriptional regulator [Bacteroidaceae bacterium]|nr:helix-turn-helix transcriptional regulator [Bacteroidaceae bacterium]
MQDVNTLFFNNSICDEELDGRISLDSMIKGIDSFARLANATCFVIDFDSHRMLYQSDKMLYLDGIADNQRQRESENPYWSFVDEETLNNLLLIRNRYPLVGQTIDIENYQTHICTIDYPIIIRRCKFFINQKFTPLVMRSDGITKIGLFIISPSTCDHIESFIITQSHIRYRFDFKEGAYKTFDLDASLSTQEKLILQRVQKGLTIEDIAEDLNLSVSTIKTHRMRIFKKLQVRTMPEALTVIGNYHLL